MSAALAMAQDQRKPLTLTDVRCWNCNKLLILMLSGEAFRVRCHRCGETNTESKHGHNITLERKST